MNPTLKQEMMSYYEARAPEYDDIYQGKDPASIPDRVTYTSEARRISKIVQGFGRGHLIDIACGTGYWLPHYSGNCSEITLLEQSERMLFQLKKRVTSLRLGDKCHFVLGDFFKVILDEDSFHSALTGFLISHLSPNLERIFFSKLRRILRDNAQLMIIDSAWSSQRMRSRKKKGMQKRTLNNGREYILYKRYFDKLDIERMFKRYHLKLKSCWMGNAFLVAQGEKTD